jgi:hypothetical protein
MIASMKEKMSYAINPKKLINRKVREKAIAAAKEKLMYNGLTPEEAGDKFEIIVKEEEDRIFSELKNKSIAGMLLALGIDVILSV